VAGHLPFRQTLKPSIYVCNKNNVGSAAELCLPLQQSWVVYPMKDQTLTIDRRLEVSLGDP